MEISREITEELAQEDFCEFYSAEEDEQEHSLELHSPYIKHMMGDKDFKLVPIVVGDLPKEKEAAVGKTLAKWFEKPNVLFVISTDFCHWGQCFDYMPTGDGPINEHIEKLDR